MRRFSFYLFLGLLTILPPLYASQDADTMLRKIEAQRFRWMGVKAEATLTFTTPQGKSASCSGRMTYYRLEEKMLLECFNGSGQTLFIFSTEDDEFELYLAADKTLYRGSIFDLDDSEQFSSHIKPFDLYRALKPMPVLPGQAHVASETPSSTVLNVWGLAQGKPYVKRVFTVTDRGDVPAETYLGEDGEKRLLINREDYREIGSVPHKKKEKVYFPEHIRIENVREKTKTDIAFSSLKPLWNTSGPGWVLQLPEGTRVWDLPRFNPDRGYEQPAASGS